MKNKKNIIALILIFLWLAVIFYFSNSDASSSTIQTKIVINKLVELAEQSSFFNAILLKLTEKHSLIYSIRKLAHLAIFCILQIIVFFAMKINGYSTIKASLISMICVVSYSVFDELHQYFIPGRSCQAKDVFIDSFGGICGLIISYITIIINKVVKRIFFT